MRAAYQRNGWRRRAATIHRRAEALFDDMMAALGADHPATDYADNLVNSAEDLSEILGKPTLAMWDTE